MNSFSYDGQIRRFLIQFIRGMSHFCVEFGKDRDGNTSLQQVPVFYGDSSRQVAQILKGNSENALSTVPAIACYITGLDYDRARVQEPYHVSKMSIRERSYNSTTDTWGHDQGNAFTVERLMPVPYKLTLKVDIWTSNTEQKLQLLEQMLPIFNPALEIQSTDNYIDWTSLSAIYLQNTNWSSRTVPVGAEDQIDIASITFELPIWLSLPAKVKKLGVIEKIVNSIYDVNGELIDDIANLPNESILARKHITPLDFGVIYHGNTLQLYRSHNIISADITTVKMDLSDTYSWQTLVDRYGKQLKNGITEVRLEQPNGFTVVGTVSYHPTDHSLLIFSAFSDTVPTNTLPPVTAIIDPFNMPVDTGYLNAPVGTRYLILNDIGSLDNVTAAQAWHGTDGSDLIAKANDIIEFDGTRWFVAFNATGQPSIKYCTNLKTGVQFKWIPRTGQWSRAVEGRYVPETWSIIL